MKIVVDRHRKAVYIDNTRAVRLYTGSARMCFVANGIIVKVVPLLTSWRHDERAVLRRVAKEDTIFFAPIIAYGKHWIAQPYYAAKRGRRPMWARGIVSALINAYSLYDTHAETNTNWMMIENGQPLIYDYGLV